MKLKIVKYVYEPPALAILPETEYEAAVLSRYWSSHISLSVGKGDSGSASANGLIYIAKFVEPEKS